MYFASQAERLAAPILAGHPAPSEPCQSFTSIGLESSFLDAGNRLCEARPDFVCKQSTTTTAIELKAGDLNFHLNYESSRAALQSEYEQMVQRYHFEDLPHSMTSKALFDGGRGRACLDHGFNHSIFKHLAIQASLGWQRYMVVFVKTPPKRLAKMYLERGLVFCTEKTLPAMLRTIELCQHGIFEPFMFISKRAKYWYTVTPDHTDHGQSAALVKAKARAKFEAVAVPYVAPHNRRGQA